MKRWTKIGVFVAAGLALLVAVPWTVGLGLPAEHTAAVSARVGAPPEAVWEVLTDVSAYPEWRSDVREVEILEERDGDVLRWRETTGQGTVTYRRVEAAPPFRLVVEIVDEDLPYGGSWTYQVQPSGALSSLIITEQGVVHSPIFRFFSRFVFGHDATAQAFLDDLRAWVADGPGGDGAA